MSKKTLVDALYVVPEVLLNRIFGEFPDIPMPETEEAAIIAIGKFSANMNNFLLKPLSGLDIVELLLRVGQKNSTAIDALLSGLEVIAGAEGGGGKLAVTCPTDGGVYPNFFDGFVCSGQGIESVSVDVGGDVIALTADGDTWSAGLTVPMATGKHTATFSATFKDDSTAEQTVDFETTANMELVATFPENETTYAPEEIDRIEVELSDDAAAQNASVNVSVFGQSLTLERQSGNTYKKDMVEINMISLFDWIGLNVMAVSITGEDGATTEEISFNIGSGDQGGE